MAVTDVRPELWAREIIEILSEELTAMSFCNITIANALNTEGDTFHIPTAGDVTTAAYTEGTTTVSYQSVTDGVKTLNIDQDQYGAINVSDEEVKQANQNWQQAYAKRLAHNLMDDIDEYVYGLYGDAGLDSYETGTTAWQLGATGGDFPKLIASLHRQLDDAKAPKSGRFLTLDSQGMEAARLYINSKDTMWGDEVGKRGVVGEFMGMSLIHSLNHTTEAGSPNVIHGLCGTLKDNIACAVQISPSTIESLRLEGSFGTGIRARAKFGAVVYRPATLIDVNYNETLLA